MNKILLAIGLGSSVVLLALSGLYLTACSRGTGGSSENCEAQVVLVVIDTLRADRLGCYGNAAGLTPNIDALAGEGVLFSRAFSHAPWTLPSFASVLTSTYPAQHLAGGAVPNFQKLRADVKTVGECFQEAGAKTAAVVNVDFVTATFGMDRGFDQLDFVRNEGNHLTRVARDTTDAALSWLEKMKSGPFFLMVHYFDPHLVFEPPAAFRRRFAMEQDKQGNDPVFGTRQEIMAFRRGELTLDAGTIERLEALYNGEVAYTDEQLGRLMQGLETMGLEDAVVVVTSDHGEEFHDHGNFEHGHTLYDELIHVPLLIRWPGCIPAGLEVDSQVRHIDLAPTLLRLAGLEPPEAFEGFDLAPLWTSEGGGENRDRPVFSEGNFWGPPRFSRRAGRYKTIAHVSDRRIEIFDLEADPQELNDLSMSDKELKRRLTDDLFLARQGMRIEAGDATSANLTPAQLERLKALGYGY